MSGIELNRSHATNANVSMFVFSIYSAILKMALNLHMDTGPKPSDYVIQLPENPLSKFFKE